MTGLRIFEHHTADVAGTFTYGDAGIDFAFTLDGPRHTAVIRSADGRPLIESTFTVQAGAAGIETTTYLGRVTIRGTPRDARPVVSGDPALLADFAELPEARLVGPLLAALAARGVAKDLYVIAQSTGDVRCASWSWWARCDARTIVSKL